MKTVKVRIKYSGTRTGSPGNQTTVTLTTTDTSYYGLEKMVSAKYPHWHNIQIIAIEER